MSRLANEFRIDEISHQPGGQITWCTLVQIIFKNLVNDLKEYGKGYSKRNLKYMSIFAKEFSNDEIAQQLAAKIPWRTLVGILYKSNSKYEELFSQPGGKIHESFSKSI